MQALQDKILAQVTAGNGKVPYTDVYEALEYTERRQVTDALRQLEAQGKARRQVSRDPESGAVAYDIVAGGA